MKRPLTISYLTVHELSTAQAIRLAARLGADFISARLTVSKPGGEVYPLMRDPGEQQAAREAMEETGVRIFDVEVARLDAEIDASAFLPMLEIGAKLGARSLLCTGDAADEARLADNFARLCAMAEGFGMNCDLEFLPWMSVDRLEVALRVLRQAGAKNMGLVIDPIHFFRAENRIADVANIPREWLHFAQICDAPAAPPASMQEIMLAAREERLNPGEGGLNLHDLFANLPRDLPVAMEVPRYTAAKTEPAEQRAAAALAATRAVLAGLPAVG